MNRKQVTLNLVRKDNFCFYSNLKTGSENETFRTKSHGVKILLKYINDGIITKCNGLDLLEGLIKMRDFPIISVSKTDQLEADIETLLDIQEKRIFLQRFSLTEKLTDLPSFVLCEDCKKHGSFILKDFISSDIDNTKEAIECLDEIFNEGKVNKKEKEKLLIEIEKSGLPKISEEKSKHLN
ncbi:MAG: hypothetical protein V4504_00690 [Patescibacteria group bacterium]